VTIVDLREIVFDAAAISAVVACSRHLAEAIGLPPVQSANLIFEPTAGKVIFDYGTARQAVPIESGPLSALLIAYCMRAGIKVPRQGARSLRIEPHAVVLVFSAAHPVPPAHLAPERADELPRSKSWMEPTPMSQRPRR
jgi:hypothetical protein